MCRFLRINYDSLAEHVVNRLSILLEMPHENLSSTPPMRLQKTDIKDKFLFSAILYSHSTPKASQEE